MNPCSIDALILLHCCIDQKTHRLWSIAALIHWFIEYCLTEQVRCIDASMHWVQNFGCIDSLPHWTDPLKRWWVDWSNRNHWFSASLLHRFIASSICWAFLHWFIVALCYSLIQDHWINGLLISWFDTLIHWSVVLDWVHLCFIDSLILCFTEPGYIVSLVGWSGFIVSLIHWFMIHGLVESLALFHRRIDFKSLVASCKFTGSLIPWFM